MITFNKLIKDHSTDIKRINDQRHKWLYFSSVVFVSVIFLIFGWDIIGDSNNKSIWWVIISLMLIVCVNWWYWTMRMIAVLLKHQQDEYQIIKDLMIEIIELKNSLNNLDKNNDI